MSTASRVALHCATLLVEWQRSTEYLAEHFRERRSGRRFEGDTPARPLTAFDTISRGPRPFVEPKNVARTRAERGLGPKPKGGVVS